MIFVTGDTHADFTKFSVHRFPEQKNLTKDDFVDFMKRYAVFKAVGLLGGENTDEDDADQ